MHRAAVVILLCLAAIGATGGIVWKWVPDETTWWYPPPTADPNPPGGAGSSINPTGILDSFDPYTIENYAFIVDEKEITAEGSVQDLVIKGLSGLKLNKLSILVADGKWTVGVELPSISAVGQYNIDGNISASGIQLPLQGNGTLTGGFTGLKLQTTVDLAISNKGQILLNDFDLVWNMTDIQVQLGGLYGGKALGEIINKLLADTLPRLVLKVYHSKITSAVITLAMEKGGPFIADLHHDHGQPHPFRKFQRVPLRNHAQDSQLDSSNSLSFEDMLSVMTSSRAPLRNHAQDSQLDSSNSLSFEDMLSVMTSSGAQETQQDKHHADVEQPSDPMGRLLPGGGIVGDLGGGLLSLEPVGDLRLHPHGELSKDREDDGVELSPEHLLSLFNVDNALSITPIGAPRLFPHGELSKDREDDGVELSPKHLLSLFNVDNALSITPIGAPRLFPHGELSKDSYEGAFDLEDAGQQLLSLLGLVASGPAGVPRNSPHGGGDKVQSEDKNGLSDAFKLFFHGETKFYPHGTLSKKAD